MGLARRDYKRAQATRLPGFNGLLPTACGDASLWTALAHLLTFMLRFLSIRDFAIIDQVELEFGSGFTVISGETGAGKSILIDALGLLLGERASTGQVASGRRQSELSAEFDLTDRPAALAWLEEQAMQEDERLLIRRVVLAEGGSRAWINGRSASIGQLAELGSILVEIHGQHEHQLLARPDMQRSIVDRQLDGVALAAVASAFAEWQAARAQIEQFERDCGDPSQIDLLRFQHRELEDLNLQPGEYETLEQEQERLARADEIKTCLQRSRLALGDESGPNARHLLREASQALASVGDLDPRVEAIQTALAEAEINLDEAMRGLERIDDFESEDPQRLEPLNRRLEKSLDLARKHRVRPEQLPDLTVQLGQRLEQLGDQDQRRQELENQLQRVTAHWQKTAQELSRKRNQAAKALSQQAGKKLSELGMKGAELRIEVQTRKTPIPTEHGQDEIRILFSANPGQPAQALQKVASGGELSRVSLALMVSARNRSEQPARIFDEVDAGIGGETAHVVGSFLQSVAGDSQAFCVTHLAQVAARADHHFRVVKSDQKGQTRISVLALDQKAREEELARMLGDRQSAGSLAHAREMLGTL